MTTDTRRPIRVTLAAAVVVLLAGGAFALAPPKGKPKGVKPVAKPVASWAEVERLKNEQKYEEAAKAVEKILAAARAKGNGPEGAKALVELTQLRIGLHGWETAVRRLREEPWPKEPLLRAQVGLLYGHSLVEYGRGYSWEISRRERVDTKGVVDLKAWTMGQIHAEALKAYLEVWETREALGKEPVASARLVVRPNNYPAEVRGTLRDAVTYLLVDLLADTSGWTPEQSNEVWRLDLGALLAATAGKDAVDLASPAVHPLAKVVAVLADLEGWSAASGRKEAQLEARLERVRRLSASFTREEERERIRRDLEARLAPFRSVPWWAMGKAEVAELHRAGSRPNRRVEARREAEEGRAAWPASAGGQRCLSIVEAIEAPEYELKSMSVDGPERRSVEVAHRNLDGLYFRAVRVDAEKWISASKDWNALPSGSDELRGIAARKAAAEWHVPLPATPDYETHRTFVAPPTKEPGLYVVFASAKKGFGGEDNLVVAACLFVSDLVLVTRTEPESGAVSVRVLSGADGRPVSGAEVALWRFDWQQGHRREEAKTTAADGQVSFDPRERGGAFHLLAKKDGHVTFDPQQASFYRHGTPERRTASFVYTDRSIYRPGQKLLWKVLAYEGSPEDARFRVATQTAVTLRLVDPNGETVETSTVTTNDFGTAAGELVVPSGRLLGSWRLESSLAGSAGVRVEEYKRPTFEVKLLEPKEPMRLNRKATLTGEARYYFGLPVSAGEARWRVTREPVWPWWWSFWGRGTAQAAQTVASGTSPLSADGTFPVAFTPEADERAAAGSREVTWRYVVSADVLDEGGETRSATRTVRLGLVSVEARVGLERGFLDEGRPASATVTRTSLDGVPRPGTGSWRLLELVRPETTPLPADLPRRGGDRDDDAPEEAAFATPGDRLRARWDTSFHVAGVLGSYGDGAERARGEAVHGENGEAKVDLGSLPAGAYRLRYTTVDDFGATYETYQDLLVAGGPKAPPLPLVLLAGSGTARVGETVRLLAASGLPGQEMLLERFRAGRLLSRTVLRSGEGSTVVEIPVTDADRGGFGLTLSALRDHQWMSQSASVFVPWDDRELKLEFATFRDRLRPGTRETWRMTVKSPSGRPVEAGAAELLAYMYDRSLDVFAPHVPPSVLSVYPIRTGASWSRATLGASSAQWVLGSFAPVPPGPSLVEDGFQEVDAYGVGGLGPRGRRFRMAKGGVGSGVGLQEAMAPEAMPAPAAAPPAAMARRLEDSATDAEKAMPAEQKEEEAGAPAADATALRSSFAETAFWSPQLLTGADGSASVEFTVPDSVTSWNVWLHAVTKDLRGASLKRETKSVKELMVRPYVPRFLREGDRAELKVVVNNASEAGLTGDLELRVLDPDTNEDLSARFGLGASDVRRAFAVAPGGGANETFLLTAPPGVRTVAFRVTASSGSLSDGELRPLPVLPSRMHLVQSRFVTLREGQRKEMRFEDLAKGGDPTLLNEQMVVTVDAQLFYGVLEALPYLVNYPYECTEQTLNRFVSTGIVSSMFEKYPSVAAMAKEMSKRDVRLETWDAADPNRKMTLEESPWLVEARGGQDAGHGLAKVLDPRVAKAEREAALAKLRKAQTSLGGFPWWPGGPPSPYMTVYILHGLAKATEFGVPVPKDVVQQAWGYVAKHYRDDLLSLMRKDCCWELLTFVNYVASCYPDPSWSSNGLTEAERKEILDFSFRHWKQHSPYLKAYLALTLKRANRMKDAQLVFASVMDSAKTTEELGTFWAPEDRSWLWYNDTIESHAFALRTLTELSPKDARRDGLVQWLFLNKKLNQWKSTRATAEVLYSLVHYLKAEGALGGRETMKVAVGGRETAFTFEPDRYTGKKNQVVVPGPQVDPKTTSTIAVEKGGKGFAFASAAWHFSTEKLPEAERGDFFNVSRKYFLRENTGKEWVLKPIADGAVLSPGDQVEVQISLRTKHEAEYVHLRDPRGAGFEPETTVSRYKWDLGIAWYEEVRDSGTNFFFEQLPVGEYAFRYRLRANMAGTFRVGPATVQSMYAPEFNAYSTGAVMTVKGE